MTEAMKNAQAREVRQVGKALSIDDKIAILKSIPTDLLMNEVMERTMMMEQRLNDIDAVVNKKTLVTANNQGLNRMIDAICI